MINSTNHVVKATARQVMFYGLSYKLHCHVLALLHIVPALPRHVAHQIKSFFAYVLKDQRFLSTARN